jgi:hypothetical protein
VTYPGSNDLIAFDSRTGSRLVAINAHTGTVYWERDIPDDFK